jgi:hypothetical protein
VKADFAHELPVGQGKPFGVSNAEPTAQWTLYLWGWDGEGSNSVSSFTVNLVMGTNLWLSGCDCRYRDISSGGS